jgi:hypothetical protein
MERKGEVRRAAVSGSNVLLLFDVIGDREDNESSS